MDFTRMIEVEDPHQHHHHHVAAWPPTWQARLGLLAFAVVILGLNATGVVRQVLGLDTALIIAALAGEFVAAAEVVIIVLVGDALEHWAMHRAERAIAGLMSIQPDRAMV